MEYTQACASDNSVFFTDYVQVTVLVGEHRSKDSRVKTILPESSCIRDARSVKSEPVYLNNSSIVNC